MKTHNHASRSSAQFCERAHGLRYLAMSSALILIGLYSSCGGGGGGGGGGFASCDPAANIDGMWYFDAYITNTSGDWCYGSPGDWWWDGFGTIVQSGKALTCYVGYDVYTGAVCKNEMDLHRSYGEYDDSMIGTIKNYGYGDIIIGTGVYDDYDWYGQLECSTSYEWTAWETYLAGGGDGENGASVFNDVDKASAVVIARSTGSSSPRTQVLGTVLPGEGGDFPLPPGYWDLYMIYPGEHSRLFELAH